MYLLFTVYGAGCNDFYAVNIHFEGHWKGVGPEIETFLSPEMALAAKKSRGWGAGAQAVRKVTLHIRSPSHSYRPLDGTIKKSMAPYQVNNILLRDITNFFGWASVCYYTLI
jgi:hypothetical protein